MSDVTAAEEKAALGSGMDEREQVDDNTNRKERKGREGREEETAGNEEQEEEGVISPIMLTRADSFRKGIFIGPEKHSASNL